MKDAPPRPELLMLLLLSRFLGPMKDDRLTGEATSLVESLVSSWSVQAGQRVPRSS